MSSHIAQKDSANLHLRGYEVLGPMVYLIERDEAPLYVGMSAHGLARALNPRHEKISDLRETDSLSIWLCPNIETALRMEHRMIRKLRPARNVRSNPSAQRDPWDEIEGDLPLPGPKAPPFRSEIWARLRGQHPKVAS